MDLENNFKEKKKKKKFAPPPGLLNTNITPKDTQTI